MLDHGVKLTWMIILTTGAICNWPVLWALAKITGCWWIPVTFGTAMTTLILTFDLGMTWNLNPYEFPVWFCLAQMTIVSLSLAVVVGVTATWYYAALAAAVWPLRGGSALRWQHWFILPVVIVPVVSTALQMGFALKYNAYVQIGYDNTFCDITEPLWPKLFGWGAMPLLCITPCAIFTIYSIPKLQRTMRAHQSLWADMANQFRIERPLVSSPAIPASPRSREDPFPSSSNSTTSLYPTYGLIPIHSPHPSSGLGLSSPQYDKSARNSAVSSIYSLDKLAMTNDEIAILHLYKPSLRYLTLLDETDTPIGGTPSRMDGDISRYGGAPVPVFPDLPPRPTSSLFAQIWRLQLFLFVLLVVCLLLTLPTLVSITQHRGPRQFGTDHIAGLLGSWAVPGVFGHSPAVLRILFPRRRRENVLPFG